MEKTKRSDPSGLICMIGTLMAVVGAVSYWVLMDNPWIRSTAAPNIALVAIGLILCFWAMIRRRSKGIIAGNVLSVLLGGGFLVVFFFLMELPEAGGAIPNVGDGVPDFALLNQNGQKVSLSATLAQGPALLVFYRGHW